MVARYPKSGGVVNITRRLQNPAERTMLEAVTVVAPGPTVPRSATDASRVGCVRQTQGISATMAAA